MQAIVATEATWKVVVAQIVRVDTPSHIHFWKNIAEVNLCDVVGRLPDLGTLAVIDFGVR